MGKKPKKPAREGSAGWSRQQRRLTTRNDLALEIPCHMPYLRPYVNPTVIVPIAVRPMMDHTVPRPPTTPLPAGQTWGGAQPAWRFVWNGAESERAQDDGKRLMGTEWAERASISPASAISVTQAARSGAMHVLGKIASSSHT